MLNHTRFREGIQLEPSYATDPATGIVGDIYLNSVTNKIRMCIQSTPTVIWSDISIAPGTVNSAPLVWSTSQYAWVENPELSLNSNSISTNTTDLQLSSPSASVSSNNDGKNISIIAGDGDGTGLQGKLILDAHSLLPSVAHGTDPVIGTEAEIYYNTVAKSYKFFDGISWRLIGSGSGFYKVTAHDAVDTTLPTGISPIIDSYTVQEGDEILFTNLAVDNNIIYKAIDVAIGVTWLPVLAFSGLSTPDNGDAVIVQQGHWANQVGVYTGSSWTFSEKIRQFNGPDYFEQSAVMTSQILNNNNGTIFSVGKVGSEYMVIDYSIKRGTAREVGQLFVVHNGTNATLAGSNSELAPTGVMFSVGITGANIILYYLSDNAGVNGEMKFSVKRWSDATGGPEGIPSYTATITPSVAGGNVGEIQFNDGTYLSGSSNFKINTVDNALDLNGMQILPLQGPVSLLDNQPTSTTIFSFPKVWEFVEVEYSAERDTNRRRGRFFIVNNGTTANIYESFAELTSMNLIFTVSISGGNVNVEYISSPNGFNSSFKYQVNRWQ